MVKTFNYKNKINKILLDIRFKSLILNYLLPFLSLTT